MISYRPLSNNDNPYFCSLIGHPFDVCGYWQITADQRLYGYRLSYQNLVGDALHLLFSYPLQPSRLTTVTNGADLLRTERIFLHDKVAKIGSQTISVGVLIHSSTVLLDLH